MSRVPWKEGKVVSFATRDGVYALGQMVVSPYIMFFQAFHDSHDWPALDLASTPTLFCRERREKRGRESFVRIDSRPLFRPPI
jgi:hypothetical protein